MKTEIYRRTGTVRHDNKCFKLTLRCSAEEHEHMDSCRDDKGKMICPLEDTKSADRAIDPILHVVCTRCWPELHPGIIALCGTVLMGNKRNLGDQCVVCLDLYDKPCKVCSAP